MNNKLLTITKDVAEQQGLIFNNDIAKMAAMTIAEINQQLIIDKRSYTGDDKLDSEIIFSILLNAYRNELLVNSIMDSRHEPLNKVLSKPKALSWRDVFYTHLFYGDQYIVNKTARDCGYPMYWWNGIIYKVDQSKEIGTAEELGLIE